MVMPTLITNIKSCDKIIACKKLLKDINRGEIMSDKDEIHAQIIGGLKGAKFPIKTPTDLLASFPEGADTTCQSGDIKVTAGEAGTLLKESDFPFKSAKQVADIIVQRAGL